MKSYGAEASIQREFDEANNGMTTARAKASALTVILNCTNLLVALMMVLFAVLTGGYLVVLGQMLPATLLTVFYIANRYSMPVMDFANAYVKVKGSWDVRKKLDKFLREHPETLRVESAPVRTGLELRGLSFSYQEGIPVLSGLSFSF